MTTSRLILYIFLLSNTCFSQTSVSDQEPEFYKNHGIKRIYQLSETWYHQANNITGGDTTALWEYNTKGQLIYKCGFYEHKPYYANDYKYDSLGRLIESNRYNPEGKKDNIAKYIYSGKYNYLMVFIRLSAPDRPELMKYYFDDFGNEIKIEKLNIDSIVLNSDYKIYNQYNKLLRRDYVSWSDTIVASHYSYKNDSILIGRKFFNKGKLSSAYKMEYNEMGLLSATHYDEKSSWYYFYDSTGRIKSQRIDEHLKGISSHTKYLYNSKGLLISMTYNKDTQHYRTEKFYHKDGILVKKEIIAGNKINTTFYYKYLEDGTEVISQIPYFSESIGAIQYIKRNKKGHITESFRSKPFGECSLTDTIPIHYKGQHHFYVYNQKGLKTAFYQKKLGWSGNSVFCPRPYVYGDPYFGRREKPTKNKNACDTLKRKSFKGGKLFIIKPKKYDDIIRYSYVNNEGEIDSIIDRYKDDIILNRMIWEKGKRISYFLEETYHYDTNDSLTKIYEANSSYNGYSTSLNLKEEHQFSNGIKIQSKIYRHKEPDIITYSHEKLDTIYRTTQKSDYKRPYYDRLIFKAGKLMEISEVDKQRSNSKVVSYSYNTSGQITEIKTEYIQRSSATNYIYEYY